MPGPPRTPGRRRDGQNSMSCAQLAASSAQDIGLDLLFYTVADDLEVHRMTKEDDRPGESQRSGVVADVAN